MSKARFFVLLTLFAVLSGIVQGIARSVILHFFGVDSLLLRCVLQDLCNAPLLCWVYFSIKKMMSK